MSSSTRLMEITTSLGGEVLLFHRMHGQEELGRVGEFQVDLLSLKKNIAMNDLLGTSMTVKLALQDDSERFFTGYVTRFSQGDTWGKYYRYHAVLRPWLWFLSRTSDCRIFQDANAKDIVGKVFEDHATKAVDLRTTSEYHTRTYCVQYRETDLNFISRLLEEEGMYYYVRHEDGKHTLVLADSYSAHEKVSGGDIPFMGAGRQGRDDIEHISDWQVTREIQPGAFEHDAYDLERPSTDLKTRKKAPHRHQQNEYELYDYPGAYLVTADGQELASVRLDEYAAQFEVVRGVTNVRDFPVGSLFKLIEHPRDDQNREYLIVSAAYDLESSDYEAASGQEGAGYRCIFTAIPSSQQFRPRRLTPKPFVQGPQTAVVMGPSGEEIYTDKYGRVKVLFHWDRQGAKAKDENTSCWIRVSQPWAGKNWGAVALPRMGQEVVVDFLEGDPDQPIVTGRVYNAEQMPPYALPANATQTGILTRSSKGGAAANANELRFEDKKGSEQVYLHAEKNQDIEVENDETHWVGHDRKKTIDHDETTHVKHDRTETVDNNETITVHGARTETVDKDETISIGANRTETVEKNESISISGNRTESVTGDESVDIGKNQSVSITGNRTLAVEKDESISITGKRTDQVQKDEDISVGKSRKASVKEDDLLKVGKKYLVDAGDEITIKTGSASITMKKDGTITIKGKDVTVEGSGKINVKASSDVVIKGSKVTQN